MHNLSVAIVGFGNIAYGLAQHTSFKQEYPVATHVEAINLNRSLTIKVVVEPDPEKQALARQILPGVEVVDDCDNITTPEEIHIVVVTKPSEGDRIEILRRFKSLVAAVLEKPVGVDIEETKRICAYISQRKLKVAVPYLRRYDKYLQNLNLIKEVGPIQCASIIYGGGLANNGSHYLDLVEMLIGEISLNQVIGYQTNENVRKNRAQSSLLITEEGIPVTIAEIDFDNFRENSLDVWGRDGRWVLCQEGSRYIHWRPVASRFGMGLMELDWIHGARAGKTNIGESFSELYRDLILSIVEDKRPISSEMNALKVESVVAELSPAEHSARFVDA